MVHQKQDVYAMLGKGMDVAGFGGRLAAYFIIFILINLFLLFGLLISDSNAAFIHLEPYLSNNDSNTIVSMILSALPCILWELRIRHFRKKHGLSIYKNIYEDLQQMKVNEEIARKQKAFAKVQQNDISYWYDLLQKGAISQEEYDAKKKELL